MQCYCWLPFPVTRWLSQSHHLRADPYILTKQVIAAGGARASGGAFVLTGTIAQSSAATVSAGSYQLRAGFYAPEALGPLPDAMFKNGFEN